MSTCYLCRVSYDANKQLTYVSGYKNKGGNFSALRLLVNYKALLKPTFYYQVSIMETNSSMSTLPKGYFRIIKWTHRYIQNCPEMHLHSNDIQRACYKKISEENQPQPQPQPQSICLKTAQSRQLKQRPFCPHFTRILIDSEQSRHQSDLYDFKQVRSVSKWIYIGSFASIKQ